MNDHDWTRISVMLGNWWSAPTPWSDQASEAYRLALDGYDPALVVRALSARLEAGSPFRPSAAELVGALIDRPRHPSPEQAWPLIEQAVRMVGRSVYAQDFAEHHQAAVDWLAGQDVAVALWAARRGLCGHGSLGAEEVQDPEFGGAVRHRLAGEYREVRARVEEREAVGQGVTRAELAVRGTGEGGGGMGEIVERLRPAPELESGA